MNNTDITVNEKTAEEIYTAKPLYLFIKRSFDILLSAFCLIVLSPLFLTISIIIKCNDGGRIFYAHTRIGYKGKPVKIYKFRSMKTNADDLRHMLTDEQLKQYYTEFKIDNDPRITKVGNFIRKTSIDELPQLLNILKGDLSFVGPRPVVDAEIENYGSDKMKFLSVKPGLTGYWQAYARNDVTYTDGKRQAMELFYVDNKSIWLDIKIIFKTFECVVKKTGA